MSWIRGGANDYQDFSDELVAAATGLSLQIVDTISDGGSGYVVGDIITLTGGTVTIDAQLEVVEVSTGTITVVRIYNAGVYTVAPSDPVLQGSTSGSGVDAEFDCTFASNGWTVKRNQFTSISGVVVAGGGTGYSVNDIITLADGVHDTVATLKVTAETGGVIDAGGVSIEDAGVYGVLPSNPVAQLSVAPTGGLGATFTLTWAAGEKEVILEGNGSGAETIYVGWRTLSGSGAYNFEFHGMTGYDANLRMSEQPGVSPGFWEGDANTRPGAYMLCVNTGLSYWLSLDSSTIVIKAKVGGSYFNAYLGYGERFASTGEYPYPMCIAGHTSHPFTLSSDSKRTSGLVDPWASDQSPNFGPMFVLDSSSVWISVQNAVVGDSYSFRDLVVVTPAQEPDGANNSAITPAEDRFLGFEFMFDDFIVHALSGAPNYNIDPTPGTTEKHMIIPTAIVSSVPNQVYMELRNVYWVSAYLLAGNLFPEDRIIDGTDTYRVFQNCNRTDAHAFLAIKEI